MYPLASARSARNAVSVVPALDAGVVSSREVPAGSVRIVRRDEIATLARWPTAFLDQRKDRRFYELVEDTLGGFEYFYLLAGSAIQPCFVLDQDLASGVGARMGAFVSGVRRLWPRFLKARTLMVGCAAGEGHLDGSASTQAATATLLASSLRRVARDVNCVMIVLKEFPASYRKPLQVLEGAGFVRAPSMPMTTLALEFKNFEDYVDRMLSYQMRSKLRRKLRTAARAKPAIAMSVEHDISDMVDEIYPLYLAVYDRSPLKFEKLTKAFLCEIGKRMPDKARFLIWRQDKKMIAFSLCTVQGDAVCHDYVGFDYAVAFELNLYYVVFRDIIEWAIGNSYKRFYSGSLNYDPKWHLRQSLYPIDLYVRHTSAPLNAILKRLMPLLEPTHSDPILPNFHNYQELWETPSPAAQN
jgi:hypothetical protein